MLRKAVSVLEVVVQAVSVLQLLAAANMQLRHHKRSSLNKLAVTLESMHSSGNQFEGHPLMLVCM